MRLSQKYYCEKICRSCGDKKDYTQFSDRKVSGVIYKHHKCLKCRAEGLSTYRRTNPTKRLLQSAKARAKKFGLEFDITEKDIKIPEKCPVLGIEIVPTIDGRGTRQEGSPSIDKIDHTRGYTKDNIVVVSWRANRMKNGFSLEELNALVNFYNNLNKEELSEV